MTAPRVMICLATKDDNKYANKFLEQWLHISYPKDKMKFIIIFGGKKPQEMIHFFTIHDFMFEVYEEPSFNNIAMCSLWIADVYNHFKKFYNGEEFVLICDTDLSWLPSDLILRLIASDKDVVAPYIWQEYAHSIFFDTYIFRYNNGKHFGTSPPFGNKAIEMESVGSIFLVKGEVFNKVKWENPAPHLQFCKNARRQGYKVWALPHLGVRHADVRKEYHPTVEDLVRNKVLPQEVLKKMRTMI